MKDSKIVILSFMAVVIIVTGFIASQFAYRSYFIKSQELKKNIVKENLFYIYDVMGGRNSIVPNIELSKIYKCIHPEEFDHVYFGGDIAESKEFIIEIKDFDNYKTINLIGNPIKAHRGLNGVDSWGTTVLCFHRDYGEFEYLWGKELK